jgi:hypothetical protein
MFPESCQSWINILPEDLAVMLYGETSGYYMGMMLMEKGKFPARRFREITSLLRNGCFTGTGSCILSKLCWTTQWIF